MVSLADIYYVLESRRRSRLSLFLSLSLSPTLSIIHARGKLRGAVDFLPEKIVDCFSACTHHSLSRAAALLSERRGETREEKRTKWGSTHIVHARIITSANSQWSHRGVYIPYIQYILLAGLCASLANANNVARYRAPSERTCVCICHNML